MPLREEENTIYSDIFPKKKSRQHLGIKIDLRDIVK